VLSVDELDLMSADLRRSSTDDGNPRP